MHPRNAIAALIVTLAILGAALLAGPASAAAPVVSVEPADPGYTTASLEGEVNPEGKETNCHFDFVNDSQFGIDEWASATQAPCAENPLNGNTLQAVSAELSNLTPHTTYHLRLVAENEDGTNTDVAPTFETEEVAKPTIEGLAVSGVTTESAHFSAEIDPNGTDPAFNATWSFTCTPSCNASSGGTVSGAADEVQGDATDLDPHTEYTIHLVASNAGGQSEATKSFTTASGAPLVNSFAAGPVQSDQVLLNGEVDPRGSPTTYWFEWGAKDCAANPCQKLASQSAGEGPYYKWAEAHLTGLEPSTTYHFRLVAENALGTTEGADQQFTTAAVEAACPNQGQLGTGVLPDCRAWEMVSPPDKNGQELLPVVRKTHISTDGDAVTYAAAGSFGEAQGASFDSEYIARRTAQPGTNGWTTRGINPPTRGDTVIATILGNVSTYLNAFTPDLSSAIYQSWRPLTDDGPNVREFENYYRIDGLGTATLTPHLLSDAVAPPPTSGPLEKIVFFNTYFVGASTDLSHVVFESQLPHTADAPLEGFFCKAAGIGCAYRLFENVNGQLHLVGRVPQSGESECDDQSGPSCIAAPTSQAALPAQFYYANRAVSDDGSRVVFQTTGGLKGGDIYLREDNQRTYQLNVSESEPAAEPKPATVWDASRDGSRVFFTTSAPLVDEDEDSAPDLYMYEVGKPAGERLTLISSSPVSGGEVEGALGTSDDGRYVYFDAYGPQLVPGQTPFALARAIYVWHDGTISYVNTYRGSAWQLNSFRGEYSGEAKRSRISPDGQHLLYMDSETSDSQTEALYLYNAKSGRTVCASCHPNGDPATTRAMTNVAANGTPSHYTTKVSHALSDDGRFVFFSTQEALSPEDTNGTWDAYEYDARTGEPHLISSGTSSEPSYFIDASDDARDVFFVTRKPLSGWDPDEASDLYDARINGGLPEPAPVPAPCEGESCLPSSRPAPSPAPAASQAPGLGNPPRSCPKGTRKVRRHGKLRCVRKRAAHKHHSKKNRAAKSNRRASK